MDIFSLVFLILCFFIVLFVMHVLANDDFVLLRRHVSMSNLFDLTFITFFIGLLSARFVYVLTHFSIGFLNPLVFFLFPYFPGLTLGGGIIGAITFVFFYTSFAKLPKERIADIFSVSFFSTLPIGIILLAMHAKKTPTIVLAEGMLIIISFVFLTLLIRVFYKGVFRDGSVCLISLSFFSLISFLADFFFMRERVFFFLSINQIMLFCLFVFSTVFFVKQEYHFFQKKLS